MQQGSRIYRSGLTLEDPPREAALNEPALTQAPLRLLPSEAPWWCRRCPLETGCRRRSSRWPAGSPVEPCANRISDSALTFDKENRVLLRWLSVRRDYNVTTTPGNGQRSMIVVWSICTGHSHFWRMVINAEIHGDRRLIPWWTVRDPTAHHRHRSWRSLALYLRGDCPIALLGSLGRDPQLSPDALP